MLIWQGAREFGRKTVRAGCSTLLAGTLNNNNWRGCGGLTLCSQTAVCDSEQLRRQLHADPPARLRWRDGRDEEAA